MRGEDRGEVEERWETRITIYSKKQIESSQPSTQRQTLTDRQTERQTAGPV
jgi:hypothetical protein